MIDVKYFAGRFPDLPTEFLLQLDDNFRKLSRLTEIHVEMLDVSAGSVNYQLPDGKQQTKYHQVIKLDSTANSITILHRHNKQRNTKRKNNNDTIKKQYNYKQHNNKPR